MGFVGDSARSLQPSQLMDRLDEFLMNLAFISEMKTRRWPTNAQRHQQTADSEEPRNIKSGDYLWGKRVFELVRMLSVVDLDIHCARKSRQLLRYRNRDDRDLQFRLAPMS